LGEVINKTKDGRFLGWYVRYVDADGKRKQRASHQPTREAARRYLVEIEARIARGHLGIPAPAAPSPTVAELCERFLSEYSRPRIKDLTQYRIHAGKCLRRSLPLLGQCRADSLQLADLIKVRDTLARTRSPATVRSALDYLGTMFNWAVGQKLMPGNPLRGIERPMAHPAIDYFTREEVAAILRAAAERAAAGRLLDKLLAACVHLALHTGLRKGELLGLRWHDLDLDTLRLTVARSYQALPKSGQARHLRLPSQCVPILQAWRPACPPTRDGLVFPIPRGGGCNTHALLGLPALLAAALVRAPAHPWHACRHTYASHYVMQGGNLLALQKILGHHDLKLTMIYAHLAPDFLGAEMERLKY
jgi:integrase